MKHRYFFSVLFALASLYFWNLMLVQQGAKSLLWAVYVLVSFLLCAVYYKTERNSALNTIALACLFGVAASMSDLILTFSLTSHIVLLTLIDIPVKLGLSVLGGIVYWVLQKWFSSERKILFTTLGVLIRRLIAGFLDLQIIILILGGLTLLSIPINLNSLVISLGTVGIVYGYKFLHEAQYKQTPAKKIMSISVDCSAARAALRNLPFVFIFTGLFAVKPFTDIFYSIIFLDLIFIFTGKRIFDLISGTKVVEAPIRIKG